MSVFLSLSNRIESIKSRAFPERLGFLFERQIRQAEWLCDYDVDHIVYGMLEIKWKSIN